MGQLICVKTAAFSLKKMDGKRGCSTMKGRSCSLNAAADFNKVFFLNHISFFLLATPFDLPLIMSSCCQDWKKHWKSSPGSNASIKNAKKNLFDVRYHFDLATRILELVAKRYTLYRLKATDQKFCTSRCPFPLCTRSIWPSNSILVQLESS